jgi:hypothetical protein
MDEDYKNKVASARALQEKARYLQGRFLTLWQ